MVADVFLSNDEIILEVNEYSDTVAFELTSDFRLFAPQNSAHHLHYYYRQICNRRNLYETEKVKMNCVFTGNLNSVSPSHCTFTCKCGLRIVLPSKAFSIRELQQYFEHYLTPYPSVQNELHTTTL